MPQKIFQITTIFTDKINPSAISNIPPEKNYLNETFPSVRLTLHLQTGVARKLRPNRGFVIETDTVLTLNPTLPTAVNAFCFFRPSSR